jgi:mono/diheme cytochrome c family protein
MRALAGPPAPGHGSTPLRPALFLWCLAALALWACAARAGRFDLPDGSGRGLVYGHCQTCHDLQSVVDSAGIRRGAWNAVLDNMVNFGLRIDDDQRARLLDYLAAYLGPKPPPVAAAEGAEGAADGASVFRDTCVACHQADGAGKPGEFPPLARNRDLFLAPGFPAAVALYGIAGPIEVRGATFDKAMPPFDFLSDDEIAAVVAYVRASWGNDAIRPAGFTDVTPAEVAQLRAEPMSASDVHAYRESLR